MFDSDGKKVVDGDQIKTARGVVLDIEVVDNEYYMKNTGNGQRSSLSIINVDFYLIDKSE